MNIVIVFSGLKQPKIQIQITSPQDPLILYMLDITEIEFHQIKTEQSILIDFQNFPSFLLKMINLCIGENNKYNCILHQINVNQALFIIQERTKFRELNHLILNFTQANDTIVKKYLGSLSMEYKLKYQNILENLNNLNSNFQNLTNENNELKDSIQKKKNGTKK